MAYRTSRGLQESRGLQDGFFELEEVPERVAVIGSGYIAVELAGILNVLGSKVSVSMDMGMDMGIDMDMLGGILLLLLIIITIIIIIIIIIILI